MIYNFLFEIIYKINQKDMLSFMKPFTTEMNITRKFIINFNLLLDSYEAHYSDW